MNFHTIETETEYDPSYSLEEQVGYELLDAFKKYTPINTREDVEKAEHKRKSKKPLDKLIPIFAFAENVIGESTMLPKYMHDNGIKEISFSPEYKRLSRIQKKIPGPHFYFVLNDDMKMSLNWVTYETTVKLKYKRLDLEYMWEEVYKEGTPGRRKLVLYSKVDEIFVFDTLLEFLGLTMVESYNKRLRDFGSTIGDRWVDFRTEVKKKNTEY